MSGRRGRILILGLLAICSAVLVAWASAATPASAARPPSPRVYVFPIAGDRVASPNTQLTFRGVSAGALGAISVVGSRTGMHTGRIEADSDGRGGSFLPAKPFADGEVVTVTTGLNVFGAQDGRYRFTVAREAPPFPIEHWPVYGRTRGDVLHFHSRPDLVPAAVTVDKNSRATAPGLLFVAPQYGPVQDGPMILGSHGNLVWFKRMSGDDFANDFRVQRYRGRPALTWWQGYQVLGTGYGTDVIYNSAYQQIGTVRAGNGLEADPHEFLITSQDSALITSSQQVWWNTSSIHGPRRQLVLDSVIQEIDIPTGLVLFQWNSLDHVPVSSSYAPLPGNPREVFDYFHVNSIDVDRDSNLVISARETWAGYKLSRQSGAMIWQLGGKRSSFRLGPGVYWALQHDIRVQAAHDGVITMFDDNAGPPVVHSESRGLKLFVNLARRTVRVAHQFLHAPPLLAQAQGNYDQLPDGHVLISWGGAGYISEYASGRAIFDAHFVQPNVTARVYRTPWTGLPAAPPSVAASARASGTTVWASWNGATDVVAWRVLGGRSANRLRPLRRVTMRGFETSISIAHEAYVEVQALSSSGLVIGTSAVVKGT